MVTIAHLSDLHFGRVNTSITKALNEELEAKRPEVVVVSGDLTQRATREEFRRARAFLETIPEPQVVVPGNHDIPNFHLLARFFWPMRRFRELIERERYPVFQNGKMAVFGMNSARNFGWYWDWSRGRLSSKQVEKAREFFDGQGSGVLRVLASHHPFLRPPEVPGARLVGRSEMALGELGRGTVDVILGGHLHRSYLGGLETVVEDGPSGVLVVQASTATSTRTRDREANAYNWITGDREQLTVTCRAWKGSEFETAKETVFVRKRGGWKREEPAAQRPAD